MTGERHRTIESIGELHGRLLACEPATVNGFVPSNAPEQKDRFLGNDSIRHPEHNYDRLDAIDFDWRRSDIEEIGEKILQHPELSPKYETAYEGFLNVYLEKTALMAAAHGLQSVDDPSERDAFAREFMERNIEVYGAPDESTYRSLLHDELKALDEKELTGYALEVRRELFERAQYDRTVQSEERFRPSNDTVAWMQDVATELYGGILSHVPEEEESKKFTMLEVRDIIANVLESEFEESAEGWRVDIESAKAINVKPGQKRIVIPSDKEPISRDKLRKLVVHECVHLMRAINGAATDLAPLRTGLADYYDAEEGLGRVMEHVLSGEFSESGVNYYIAAGAAFHDQMDFRDVFELMWRKEVLKKTTGDLQEEEVRKAKNTAYNVTMRIMRGTDTLPWFKDLAYYNGAVDVWRHLETIKGDDVKFPFLFLGKADPTQIKDERILYETKTL